MASEKDEIDMEKKDISAVLLLIERQKEIAVLIESKRATAVKYGSRRSKEIFTRIWNELQDLWSEFLTNDLILNEEAAKNVALLEQPYFTEKKKSVAENLYIKATSFITQHYPDLTLEKGAAAEDVQNVNQDGPEKSDSDYQSKLSCSKHEESIRSLPVTDNRTTNATSTADFALMKISEVLATQQKFQQQIQEQMSVLMLKGLNSGEREGLKAPRVDIPEFSGSILLYNSFKDTFNTVTNKSNISNIEKLTILKTKCTGIAENYIGHITIAEDNYDRAWKILDERFDDPVAIISTCVDMILDMPSIPPNDPQSVENALNSIQQVGSNLEMLKIDPNQVVLVRAVIRKLNDRACGELTRFIGNHKEFPSYEKLISFFINHLSILRARVPVNVSKVEETKEKERNGKPKSHHKQQTSKSHATVTSDGASYRCFICFESHLAPACPKLAESPNPYDLLKHYNICNKCVSHKFNKRKPCNRKISCDICKQEHLTVLHGKQTQENAVNSFLCQGDSSSQDVLLPTAVATIIGKDLTIEKRILIDVCSQASYVEEGIVQLLKLKKTKCDIKIAGVGGEITGKVNSTTVLKFEVTYPERKMLEVEAFVVKRVTRKLPAVPTNFRAFTGFEKPLADKFFGQSSHVPILLGANIASELFLDGIFTHGGLLLQNTRLGWIVMGSQSAGHSSSKGVVSTHVSIAEFQQELAIRSFDEELRKFWDIPVTKEDVEVVEANVCEDLFKTSHYQQPDGRYVVPIPWKQNSPELGNSYTMALKCFLALEKRLSKNTTHKRMSDEFMNDYISMGHMSEISASDHGLKSGKVYYVPYHSILRHDAVTTKLRNVFNASAKTSTGISLNQTIHAGPKLQNKIFDVITRIRQYKYMYTSDITKMYRQILLRPEDRERLRILYREHSSIPLREYSLNTITYGIDCAPWQAIRTIHQVAIDHAPNEEISNIIKHSFYMDDLFHGSDSIEGCQRQIADIVNVLNKGKLPLTKWMSNHTDVLKNVDDSKKLENYVDLKSETTSIKTLGIQYFPNDDMFGFKVKDFEELKFTKRGMLSVTASLYDPLGWILPVIMRFRILLQKTWTMELDWDDELESKMKDQFEKFIKCLSTLQHLRIPRWIGSFEADDVELVGFCDASGDGFAAVVYSRIKLSNEVNIALLTAKGRVTPLKTKKNLDSKLCTIPKMELEGLCLLADLMKEVIPNFPKLKLKLIAYTDSQIVLSWLRSSEEIENKFVRRRVTKVKKVLAPGNVHYVKSSDNPADAASRGLSADEFMNKKQLWTEGPSWMKEDVLPTTPFQKSEFTASHATQIQQPTDDDVVSGMIEKFSSFDKLVGCVSIIMMWINMYRLRLYHPRRNASLTTDSRLRIIKIQQQSSFSKEINAIRRGERLRKGHWLSYLCPYLDKDDILRVGGRLERADIPRDQKHPILIPKSHLARLIIRDIHLKNQHSPNALTDRLLKERYWIPGSRSIIRNEIHHCNHCIRLGSKNVIQPQMSDLPVERLNSGAIFEATSVDFAGPFSVRASKLKYDRKIKVWVSIFVCMATKLAHLEICTELSAENFLAAFDRFTARRSTPGLMVSDNGTNFVSANKILAQQLQQMIVKGVSLLATREIKWKFIPPGSPHFGGLHEACVKSFKYFVKRTAKVEALTYEEFNTLTCRIEAMLNSRPLYPLSTNPNDDLALTPGHFAVQRCLRAPPSCPPSKKSVTITKRWSLVQQMQRCFWEIFSKEYLSTLHKRYKWIYPQPNLKVDDVVIIKEHLTHPLDWPLGRIVKCYPDEKGIVRKVDVYGKNKQIMHRAVNKLIPLITEEEEQQLVSPRKTTRSQRKNTRSLLNLITTMLMFFFFICCSTEAFVIEKLPPGVHIRKLREVNLKAMNVFFNLQTNVNVSADLRILDEQTSKFQRFCESSRQLANSNVSSLCMERYEFLTSEVRLIKSNILGLYDSSSARKSRSIAAVSKLAMGLGGFLKKAGPYAMLGATAGLQEYENYKMRQKLSSVDQKFKKVSYILLNISETESASLQHQLDNLVEQQQQLILEAEINEFTSSIQSFISTIEVRHHNLMNIRPREELEQFVQSLNKVATVVRLPVLPSPDSIFTIFPIQRLIKDDLVILQYDIILCRPPVFISYVVVSVPEDSETIILDNHNIVQVIVSDSNNSSFFYPEDAVESWPNIYDEVSMRYQDTCTSSLLKQNSVEKFCRSDNFELKKQILPLGPHEIAVVKPDVGALILNCKDQRIPIFGNVTTINYQGCFFEGTDAAKISNFEVDKMKFAENDIVDNFVPAEIEQVTVHSIKGQIDKLKQEMEHTLNTEKSRSSEPFPLLFEIILISFLVVVVIIFFSIIPRSKVEDRSQDIALQSWSSRHL